MSRSTSTYQPAFFVVGCPRSGTTLLQRMLDAHPDLAVANDTHFIPRVADAFSIQKNCPLDQALVNAVRNYKRFHRMGLEGHEVLKASETADSYAGFISALYTRFARQQGKTIAGEKTPDYVKRIPLLHRLFPDARFIHIIRDGRDVALSTLDWATENKGPGKLELWRKEPLGLAALWWAWQVRLGRCAGRELPAHQYLEVRYESLVGESRATLRTLCQFLNIPFRAEMEHFYSGKTVQDATLSAKSAWLPATPGLRNAEIDLSNDDLALFEALTSPLLKELGYPRYSKRTSSVNRDREQVCRDWWDAHLVQKAAKRERKERMIRRDSPVHY